MQIFPTDPFSRKLARNHFKSSCPKMKCHDRDAARSYENHEIIKKFGYRGKFALLLGACHKLAVFFFLAVSRDLPQPSTVVDGEGRDVLSEWVARSNARLAAELEKAREKEKATIFAKGNEKMPSAPVEFRDANRAIPNDAAAATVIEGAATSASTPNAAARIPLADMGVERPTTTGGFHANNGGQSEDPDVNYNPVVSDLFVDGQAPRHG